MSRQARNYLVPLGQFRGPVSLSPEPVWVWIHEQRVGHGLNTKEMSDLSGVSDTTISRAERGWPTSVATTRKVLKALGAQLIFVSEDGVQHEA